MADSGSSNRDGKRKWDNGGDRRRGRGGGSMQHGSRPNKKRNMGRKEHA
jgi:tRNA pseudouridine38-40 synthase